MSETEKALVLVRKGVPVMEAARRVGCHSTTVYGAIHRRGLTLPKAKTGRPSRRIVKHKRVSHPELNKVVSSEIRWTLKPGAEIRVLRSIIASAIKGRE